MSEPKRRILIVDDESGFSSTMKEFLETTGRYSVRTETSGSMAAPAAVEFRPDVILLDFMMPDCPGPRAAALVRAQESLKGTPIVFITATTQDETQGTLAGYPFIAKPIKLDELEGKLAKYLTPAG